MKGFVTFLSAPSMRNIAAAAGQLKREKNTVQDVHTICCSIVDSDWSATYLNTTFGARRHFDVVVPSSIVRDVLQAFGQYGDKLFVKWAGHADRIV